MLINHPILGPRDAQEFTYLGDASLLNRPDWQSENVMDEFHDYLHIRNNPLGYHHELWYHEHGDRSWLVLTRHTMTHEITKVEFAADVKREMSK